MSQLEKTAIRAIIILLRSALSAPLQPDDPLRDCSANHLTLLTRQPDKAQDIAYNKFYEGHFSEVKACWRRLYEEAGLWKALFVLEATEQRHANGIALPTHSSGEDEHAAGKGETPEHHAVVSTDTKAAPQVKQGIVGVWTGEEIEIHSDDEEEQGSEAEAHDDAHIGGDTCGWMDNIVRILDMILIMTGAPGRAELIEQVFRQMEQPLGQTDDETSVKATELDDPVAQPHAKRRKLSQSRYAQVDSRVSFNVALSSAPLLRHPISRKHHLSISEFSRHMSSTQTSSNVVNQPTPQPLIITGALEHWPAVSDPSRAWDNPQHLLKRTLGGRRLVPVELGRSYTDEGWGQKIITIGEFMNRYMLAEMRTNGSSKADEGDQERKGYLAQHDLFAQIPSLRADIRIPDYCYTDPPQPSSLSTHAETDSHVDDQSRMPPKLDEPLLNAWFGPAGTISPLHTDPYHNILAQVVGYKYVRLYAPDQGSRLYPRGVEGLGVNMDNTSRVDVSKYIEWVEAGPDGGYSTQPRQPPDADKEPKGKGADGGQDSMSKVEHGDADEFPLFRDAEYVEGILGPGECLYIPHAWWHYVQSLSPSFSVSFWWN